MLCAPGLTSHRTHCAVSTLKWAREWSRTSSHNLPIVGSNKGIDIYLTEAWGRYLHERAPAKARGMPRSTRAWDEGRRRGGRSLGGQIEEHGPLESRALSPTVAFPEGHAAFGVDRTRGSTAQVMWADQTCQ